MADERVMIGAWAGPPRVERCGVPLLPRDRGVIRLITYISVLLTVFYNCTAFRIFKSMEYTNSLGQF